MLPLRKTYRYLWFAGATLLLATASGARPGASGAPSASAEEHTLRLYNTHTNEKIDIVTNEVRHFDPRLYDILSDLTASVGHPSGEIDIVCGYRTTSTNAALRAHTNGVAKNSLHIQAEAIDLRMPGVNTLKLRKAALALARGGVGYYPHSDFIHVDTGRVRQWCFDCPASLNNGD